VLMSRDDGKRGVGHERATLSMSFQVVARFLATTAHNHECRPVFKPLVIRKTKNSLRTLKDRYRMRNFLPRREYLTPLRPRAVVTTSTERKDGLS
jgi:hypothetical protein